jgi:hypothetical protein
MTLITNNKLQVVRRNIRFEQSRYCSQKFLQEKGQQLLGCEM